VNLVRQVILSPLVALLTLMASTVLASTEFEVNAARTASEALSADQRKSARDLFAAAFEDAKAGSTDSAILMLRRGLTIDPADFRARMLLGQLLESKGDANGANAQYRAVVALAPPTAVEAARAEVRLSSDWPARPIRLIVSFPAGHAVDMFAREFARLLAQRLGQSVSLENRAGANGAIAVDAVAKATPDGYTFGMASQAPISIIPALKRKLPYDPVKDLVPITLAGYAPMVLLVRKDAPINSVADLIAQSKARPGAITYGSLGTGSISHLVTEAFKAATGAPLTEVPYKGSAQRLTDLIGGRIGVMFTDVTSAAPQLAGGMVRALGVSSLKRDGLLPEVPTLDESGVPLLKGFEALGWIGVIAPAGTPAALIERMQVEMTRVLQDPAMGQRIRSAGVTVPDPNTPAQFAEYIRRDLERWSKLVNDLKIVGIE
jgi:tripartite-type tricarboxylate transporter receptor subunit TctC